MGVVASRNRGPRPLMPACWPPCLLPSVPSPSCRPSARLHLLPVSSTHLQPSPIASYHSYPHLLFARFLPVQVPVSQTPTRRNRCSSYPRNGRCSAKHPVASHRYSQIIEEYRRISPCNRIPQMGAHGWQNRSREISRGRKGMDKHSAIEHRHEETQDKWCRSRGLILERAPSACTRTPYQQSCACKDSNLCRRPLIVGQYSIPRAPSSSLVQRSRSLRIRPRYRISSGDGKKENYGY